MFNNDIKRLLTRSLWDTRQSAKTAWLKRRNYVMDYYRGDVDHYTRRRFSEDMWDKIVWSNVNITRRIINRISLVYSEPTTRKVKNDNYAGYTRNKQSDLLYAERITNLLNVNLIKVSWRNDRFEYDVIRDWEAEMHPTGRDEIVRVSFPLNKVTSVTGAALDLWEQWDEESIITFDHSTKTIIEERENLLGMLPFVVVKTTEGQLSAFDIEPALDIASVNEVSNVNNANMNANIHFQSFKTHYALGIPGEDGTAPELKIAPGKILVIPDPIGTASIGTLDSVSTTNDVIKAVLEQSKAVAATYHLTSGFVESDGTPTSGVALRIRNEELRSFRQESITLWRKAEDRIYDIERQVVFTNTGVTLPDAFSVDFGEKAAILTQQEAESQNAADLAMDLTTPALILQRRDPDMFGKDGTLQEYQDFIDENKKVNNPEGTEVAEPVVVDPFNSLLQAPVS